MRRKEIDYFDSIIQFQKDLDLLLLFFLCVYVRCVIYLNTFKLGLFG